jgi:tripartite-type tricarboxylate transporter receptor subunit TctC
MRGVISFLVLAAGLLGVGHAKAAWPERPVVVVVPFAAGGIADVIARLAAEQLRAAFKQSFVVENQPGGAGIIAAERVAKARPDGYTLLSTPIFQITMAQFTHRVTFDPVKDFKPIAGIAASPFAITVGGLFPANTLPEFIAYVKARPGQLTFGSAGTGSLTHVSSAVFLRSAGLDMVHVPYRGVAPAFTDLIAGHIDMLSASPVELKPYLDSGKVKALAVTSAERSGQLPQIPTIAETLKSPPVVTYNGLLAPAQTPDEIVSAIVRALNAPATAAGFRALLAEVGADPIVGTPEQFARIIAADTEQWRSIVRDLNLTAE